MCFCMDVILIKKQARTQPLSAVIARPSRIPSAAANTHVAQSNWKISKIYINRRLPGFPLVQSGGLSCTVCRRIWRNPLQLTHQTQERPLRRGSNRTCGGRGYISTKVARWGSETCRSRLLSSTGRSFKCKNTLAWTPGTKTQPMADSVN